MIVVMANDFPACVLPRETTMEQAQEFAKKLQDEDACNIEHRRQYPHQRLARVYYHIHDVPEVTPT